VFVQGFARRSEAVMVEWLAQAWSGGVDRLAADLLSPWSRSGLLAILAGWLIGAFAFRHYFGREGFSLAAYLRHAFPARVYRSRSFAVDVQIYLLGKLVTPMRLVAKVVSVTFVAQALAAGLTGVLGPLQQPPQTTAAVVALAALLLMASDFGTYVTHRLSHELPALWAFHRVHHSAEELNPLTLNRQHPVYSMLGVLVDCATVAPMQAVILYAFGAAPSTAVLAWANFGFVLFTYCAASLRHTHIWLSYGPVVERLVVSPALHQIHHSRAPRHFDKNYGEMLSLWDWLFGTLYLPKEREELQFGIGDEDAQPHPTLVAAMVEPFGYAWRVLRRPGKADAAGAAMADQQR
jgi:sterol desaturase/sphingolipid hydroxylase (fatty acid hydroxylase superfamily)